MDIAALDRAVQQIAIKRNELKKIDYNNPKYDDLEEELHDLEDAVHVKYGEYLEEVLQEVHDKLCPDTDVLFPIAYVAKTYSVSPKNEFTVAHSEGVFCGSRQHAGQRHQAGDHPQSVAHRFEHQRQAGSGLEGEVISSH